MEKGKFVEALEEEAVQQLAELRRYRVNASKDNPDLRARAKLAIGVIGAYVRLRATIENGRSNDLVERRLLGEPPAALPSGPSK
jgi:hypothetical protein